MDFLLGIYSTFISDNFLQLSSSWIEVWYSSSTEVSLLCNCILWAYRYWWETLMIKSIPSTGLESINSVLFRVAIIPEMQGIVFHTWVPSRERGLPVCIGKKSPHLEFGPLSFLGGHLWTYLRCCFSRCITYSVKCASKVRIFLRCAPKCKSTTNSGGFKTDLAWLAFVKYDWSETLFSYHRCSNLWF